jgi:hypothetical protein
MPERRRREPEPWSPSGPGEGGPKAPKIEKPDTKKLLEKMRKIDPNSRRRFRQRSGQ